MLYLLCSLFAAAIPANAAPMGPWLDEPASTLTIDTAELAPVEPPDCDAWRMADGIQLGDRPELWSRWKPQTAWGTPYLVRTLEEAFDEVASVLPYVDPVAVGDMSARGGGPLHGHLTHDVGVDADIGLFLDDGRQPTNGTFEDATAQTLDHEATWTLIKALIDTGRVQFILLDDTLIRSMRTWLTENEVVHPDEIDRIFPLRGSAVGVRGVVRHAPGHRNHLHVRVACQ